MTQNNSSERSDLQLSNGRFLRGHPAGLSTLFFTELWERFSYYGMRALLTLFMVAAIADGGLGFSPAEAGKIYGNYTMAVYMLSIPGGFIADRILGARRAVMIGGSVIALGHFSLALPELWSFYLGLILIALGTGLFKPNISALVGALYQKDDPRRDAGFSLFYMGINIGAFIAPLITGFLAQSILFKNFLASAGFDPTKSWHWGFAAAGIGMTVAILVFSRKSRVMVDTIDPDRPIEDLKWLTLSSLGILAGVVALIGLIALTDLPGLTWLRWLFLVLPVVGIAYAARQPDAETQRLAAIGILFIASMIFWAVFEQAGTTIALFADTLTKNEIAGVPFPSAWFQSVNPVFVILLTPIFVSLWVYLGRNQPSAAAKFALGLGFLAASFLLMVPAAQLAASGRVSPLWLIGLFFLFTTGELLLSPVGLSAMTKLAPAGLTGLVLGLWFLSMAFGSKLAGILSQSFTKTDPASLADGFLWQSAVVAGAAIVLALLVPWYRRLTADRV